jgi:cytochrome c oxidase cbb3-type subunit 3
VAERAAVRGRLLTWAPNLSTLPSVTRSTKVSFHIRRAAAVVMALAASACATRAPDVVRDDEVAAQADLQVAAGAEAFARYCALCHGADATGYAADHAPSLVSRTFLESASDEQIARGIRDGRPGTAMAPYGKARGGPLDDEGVAAILAFLRERGPVRVRLPATAVLGDAASGDTVYAANCQRCHGTQADRGDAVHLANAAFLAAASDAFLRYAVVHGRPGTPMPAFAGVLREDEIDNAVAFLRSSATPPPPERRTPPEPPPLGPVVINPSGKTPDFTLREGRYVPIDDVLRALDEKKRLVIIDARASSDWITLHIPGSISVPYYAFSRLDALPRDGTWITAYCACPHHASGVVVDELRKRGFAHTAVLDEGILEWKKRGYPIAGEPVPGEVQAGKPAAAAAPARSFAAPARAK